MGLNVMFLCVTERRREGKEQGGDRWKSLKVNTVFILILKATKHCQQAWLGVLPKR